MKYKTSFNHWLFLRYFFLIALFVWKGVAPLWAQETPPSEPASPPQENSQEVKSGEEVFELMIRSRDRLVPPKAQATLDSELVKAQIKRIPRDDVDFGKNPLAKIYFNRNKKPSIKIINVSDYYSDILSVYNDVLEKSGLYLATEPYDVYEQFSTRYTLKVVRLQNDLKEIKIRDNEALEGDYGIFSFDSDWKVIKTRFYEDNREVANATYEYTNVRPYTLVSKIDIHIYNRKPDFISIVFKDYEL